MNKQELNQIEKYLDNELSEEERIAFELAVKGDKTLKKQLQEVIHARIEAYEKERASLQALLQKENSHAQSTIPWAIRLVIVALVALILFFVISNLLQG